MGMQATSTKLTYARNDYLKVGHSFIFDRVGDMIYYVLKNNDISIGDFSGATAGSGIPLTSSKTGAFKVFADDNDTDIGSGTLARAIWGRTLVTTGSQNAELAGVQGSVVVSTSEIIHNAGGVLGSLEARGSSSLNGTAGQNIFAAVLGRVGAGDGVTFNIKTGAVCAGLAAMSNIDDGSTTTQTGTTAGVYVGQWPGTDDWDYGIYIASGTCTTGIYCDAPLTVTGTLTIPADSIDSDDIDPSVVQISVDKDLSMGDIKGMYASPVKVLDAVADKIIIVEWIDFIMTRTATAYTDGDSVHFRYEDNGPLIANITAGYITGDPEDPPDAGTFVISKAAMSRSGDEDVDIVNKGIYISNPNQAFATGTGTAVARIRYRLIDDPTA